MMLNVIKLIINKLKEYERVYLYNPEKNYMQGKK